MDLLNVIEAFLDVIGAIVGTLIIAFYVAIPCFLVFLAVKWILE